MRQYAFISLMLTCLGVPAAMADTTDREHVGGGLRQDENHLAAWQALLEEQSTSQVGGGLFRRSGCRAADFNKPECIVERDNDNGGGGDSGGGHSGGGDDY